MRYILLLSLICHLFSCNASENPTVMSESTSSLSSIVTPGAHQLSTYLPQLKGQRVGLIVNHTSVVNETHLVDTLLSHEVDVRMIFSPEHGFKGTAYNGEEVKDGLYLDRYPIRSLYGKSKKPSAEDLTQVDVLVFDIQDVGARFYTYI